MYFKKSYFYIRKNIYFYNTSKLKCMKTKLLSSAVFFGLLINAQSYSNGPLSTGALASDGTPAPSGYTWSELQPGNSTLGIAGYINANTNTRIADDFTIPNGEVWEITSVEIFAYETGEIALPFDRFNLRFFDGKPETGTVIAGDTSTNILSISGSSTAYMYRINNVDVPNLVRKIYKVKGIVDRTFGSGTYWLDWQLHTYNNGAAFFPFVTTVGNNKPNGNAVQLLTNATVYTPAADSNSPNVNQAMPFIVNYNIRSLGTKETRQYDSRMIIYPNPTTEYFKLELPAELLGKKITLSVYDASGKMVKTFKISETYNVSDLSKGIYLVKVNDGKNLKTVTLIKK